MMDFETIKKNVSFENTLANYGYERDSDKSCRKWEVYKSEGKEPLLLTQSKNGNYLVAINASDNTVLDVVSFVKKNNGEDWKETIKYFENEGYKKLPNVAEKTPSSYIKNKISSNFSPKKYENYSKPIEQINPNLLLYLTETRKIDKKIIFSERFSNIKIYEQNYSGIKNQSLLIPNYHKAKSNITNYEFYNSQGGKYNSKGGEKSLYVTTHKSTDDTLIITESNIDLYSYYCLNPQKTNLTGISTGGNISQKGYESLSVIIQAKNLKKVVIAMDNDVAGKKMAKDLKEFIMINKKKSLEIIEYQNKYKDLNEYLIAKKTNFKNSELPIHGRDVLLQ